MSQRLALVLACVAGVAACTKDFDQFEPDGFGTATGAGGATVGAGSTVGVTSVGPGGSSTSATTGPGSTSASTGATTGSGGGSSSAAQSSAASTAASSAASTAASSGAGGTGGAGPVLSCANQACAPGEVCCHNGNSPQGDGCAASGACGSDTEISCSGPASCPVNQVCCGILGGPNFYMEVSCQTTCLGIVMCAGDPGVCDANQTCTDSMTLGMPYQYCG
jgi:hypothetical protein